ncbi:flippase [Olsenella sp. An188]|uniref:flippase n=1 Tax=Olsenella sp. An188 TaxID=1965579 RepID=UPI000B3A6832|nr:flippase [Olsenella sp. An188]OUP38144.1 hypothetical protein B5F23_07840 [Olsenella sp. An188]
MSIRHNFIYNLSYQILSLILPLVTAPFVSRVLGATNLGTYSYTYSVAYYFVLVAMLGVNNYGNREVAKNRSNPRHLREVFWSIWVLQFALSVACTVIYTVYSLEFADDRVVSLIWVPYVISAGLDINWLFFGLEQFKLTTVRNTAIKIITVLATLALVQGENALQIYVCIMSAQFIISALVLWPAAIKRVPPIKVEIRGVLSHIKPNLVLFIPVVAVSLYTVLDKVMLGQMSTMEQTGYFENAYKVANMPFTVITALGTVMLPHASNLFASGRKFEAIEHMAPSMWFAMLLSSAFCFGLTAIAPELAPVFFGPGYDPCSILMIVIVLDMPFMAWANVIRTQWLIPTGKDRSYISSVMLGAVVNLASNCILIPRFGAFGAAVGTLLAEITVCVAQTVAVRQSLPIKRWIKENIPSLVNGLIMLGVVRMSAGFVEEDVVGVLVEITVGMVTFTLITLLWTMLTKNEYAESLVLTPIKTFVDQKIGG